MEIVQRAAGDDLQDARTVGVAAIFREEWNQVEHGCNEAERSRVGDEFPGLRIGGPAIMNHGPDGRRADEQVRAGSGSDHRRSLPSAVEPGGWGLAPTDPPGVMKTSRVKFELPLPLPLHRMKWASAEAQQPHLEAPRKNGMAALVDETWSDAGDGDEHDPTEAAVARQVLCERPASPEEEHGYLREHGESRDGVASRQAGAIYRRPEWLYAPPSRSQAQFAAGENKEPCESEGEEPKAVGRART